ncbi:MAG: hypothetical protein MUD15_03895 [Desulfobacterota bacterium]|nr:hypothetical protein [Thermodesulfobacteriota bacterium]
MDIKASCEGRAGPSVDPLPPAVFPACMPEIPENTPVKTWFIMFSQGCRKSAFGVVSGLLSSIIHLVPKALLLERCG